MSRAAPRIGTNADRSSRPSKLAKPLWSICPNSPSGRAALDPLEGILQLTRKLDLGLELDRDRLRDRAVEDFAGDLLLRRCDGTSEIAQGKRLPQNVADLKADRRLHGGDVRMAGYHDELRFGMERLAGGDMADEFESVDPGHAHIGDNNANKRIAL